ncbi:unnamed protein product [Adineta ricciae]|uniref:Uncharacterized protein n=1 Tax=Adineta ricciae TaxID=249248 RepID=A0A815REB6_ADIRI|nr:unnamed protein product [Adineta ricciae]CAF1474022.1 unnamed protein product [Adineta ricciae]
MSHRTDSSSSLNNDEIENNVMPSDASPENRKQDSMTDYGWANFNAFEKQESENNKEEASNSNWADFQHVDRSNEEDDDAFGAYGEVQERPKTKSPTFSVNSLSNDQIEAVISACFPLESPSLCTENDNLISFPLPTFTKREEQIKQSPAFQHSLSLWSVLVNVSNDPLGIQYQWRKSNIERSFHQALGVQERFRTKTIPADSPCDDEKQISNDDVETKLSCPVISPSFDWKSNGLENPLTDNQSTFLSTDTNRSENHVVDVNKTLDLDYYIPPISTANNRRQQSSLATIVHRNSSPNPSLQSTSIKTMDLFPGSTTMITDDAKVVQETVPSLTFINPKALLLSTQANTESNVFY